MTDIDPEIAWYYGKGRESTRLAKTSRLEEARTRRIIASRLDSEPQTIIDIGGGAGAYAFWLAERGHTVHLVDPIALHIEQARAAAIDSGTSLAGFHVSDAEHLSFDDATVDVALSLGPLYHVTERVRRIAALREGFRVLRPGGKLFAAAIGRYSSVIEGFFKGYAASPQYAAMMQKMMRDGKHHNPERLDGLFTTSYFHRPDELRDEIAESGFTDIELVAVEGAWACVPEFDRKWEDEAFRSLLMDTIEAMEADQSTIGFGGHIIAIARRPVDAR